MKPPWPVILFTFTWNPPQLGVICQFKWWCNDNFSIRVMAVTLTRRSSQSPTVPHYSRPEVKLDFRWPSSVLVPRVLLFLSIWSWSVITPGICDAPLMAHNWVTITYCCSHYWRLDPVRNMNAWADRIMTDRDPTLSPLTINTFGDICLSPIHPCHPSHCHPVTGSLNLK